MTDTTEFSAMRWFRNDGAAIDIDDILRSYFYDDKDAGAVLRLLSHKDMRMPRDRYRMVATVIACVLLDRERVSFDELLEEARSMLAVRIAGDIGYYLLLVKNDLESRKIVRVVKGIGAERRQVLFFRNKTIVNTLRRQLGAAHV